MLRDTQIQPIVFKKSQVPRCRAFDICMLLSHLEFLISLVVPARSVSSIPFLCVPGYE